MKKKVLVVDDSNLMVAVIKKFISSEFPDIDILMAHNGEECLEQYKKEHPDLVFLDIIMPGMDGIKVLEELKKIAPYARVVMCTSMKETEQEQKARSLGCADYITKPFSKEDIINAVKKYS